MYDVTNKKEMYGPGAGYNVFAGKDASKGLGESPLVPSVLSETLVKES